MNIESTKEKLLHNISIADHATGKNLSLPTLNNILLTTQNKSLSIRATNLDLGIEISLPVKVNDEGVVVVPGGILNSTLQHIYDGGLIKIQKTKNNNLIIKTPKTTSTIKTLPLDDFPTLPKIKNGYTLTLKIKDLLKGIKSVWYSASTSSIKPELSSVYIYSVDNTLLFVGTDSFRLAEQTIPIKKLPDFEPILIPLRNVIEITKILEALSEDEVLLDFTKNQLSLTIGNLYLTSRLIDGVFPDYKQIIPKKYTTEVILLKQDLINTLKSSRIFSDKFNQIRFLVRPSKKSFTIEASNQDIGETQSEINASMNGEDLEIGFNLKYISDVFQSISTDSLSLSLCGPGKPMVIRGVSDNSFLYLVMPMNR